MARLIISGRATPIAHPRCFIPTSTCVARCTSRDLLSVWSRLVCIALTPAGAIPRSGFLEERKTMMTNADFETPSSLTQKYYLLGAVVNSRWSTCLDNKLATVLIDKHWDGKACVSLDYLEQATGAMRPNIIASLRRLEAHGVISVIRRGASHRPTEYDLNFEFASRNSELARAA